MTEPLILDMSKWRVVPSSEQPSGPVGLEDFDARQWRVVDPRESVPADAPLPEPSAAESVYNGITAFAKQIASEWVDTLPRPSDPFRGQKVAATQLGQIERGFEQGVGGMLQGIALAGQGIEESVALATTGRSAGTTAADSPIYKLGSRVSKGWANTIREAQGLPPLEEPSGFLQKTLPSAVGQMGAMMAGGGLVSNAARGTGIAGGLLGAGAPSMATKAIGSQAGGVTFSGATLAAGSAYEEVQGVLPESDARAYATVAGLIGTLEAVPFAEFPGSLTKFAMSKILTKAPEPVRLAVASKMVNQAAKLTAAGIPEAGQEIVQTMGQMAALEGERQGDFGDAAYREALVPALAKALGEPALYESAAAGFLIGGVMGSMKSHVAKDGTPEQKADYLRTVAPEKAQAIAESAETPSRTDVEAYLPKTKAKEREAIKEALQATPEPDPAMQDTQRLVDSFVPDLFEGEAEVIAEEDAQAAAEDVAGDASPAIEPESPVVTQPPPATPPPVTMTPAPLRQAFVLPEGLSKLKPRYGTNKIVFQSDADKAIYTVANEKNKNSKAHEGYKDLLRSAGYSDEYVQKRFSQIKSLLKSGQYTIPAEQSDVRASPPSPAAPTAQSPVQVPSAPTMTAGAAPSLASVTQSADNSRQYPGEYDVVPLSTLKVSNLRDDQPNPEYGIPNAQNRKGVATRAAKINIKFSPDRLLATTVTSDGPPGIDQDGNVIYGNARVRALLDSPESQKSYRQPAQKKAEAMGLGDKAASIIASGDTPVFVKRHNTSAMTSEQITQMGADLNVPLGENLSTEELAGEIARILGGEKIDSKLDLTGDVSLREAIQKPLFVDFMRKSLAAAGLTNSTKALFAKDGFSVSGVDTIERVATRLILGDSASPEGVPIAQALADLPELSGLNDRFQRAVPALLSLRSAGAEWQIEPAVVEAVGVLVDKIKPGDKPEVTYADILSEPDLFGNAAIGESLAQQTLDVVKSLLKNDTKTHFKKSVEDYTEAAQSEDMLSSGDPAEAFASAFAPSNKWMANKVDSNPSLKVRTEGIYRARRPAPQQAGPTQFPHYAPQAITRTGKKLLRQVKAGKIGRRTIASFIRKMSRGVLYIGRQNVSARFPAYYMSTYHAIAMQSPDDIQIAVHESGHALSAALEGHNPGYRAGKDADLIALAKEAGTYASAETPEEGVAELYRRMVLNLPADPALVKWLEEEIQKFSPRFFNEYRDAANLWQHFMNLPPIEQNDADLADGRRPYTDEFGTSSYILRLSGRLAGSFLNARFLGYGVNGMLYRTLRGDKIYEEIRREEGIAAALKWRFGPISKQLRKQALEAHRAMRDSAGDVAQTQNGLLLHMADVQQAVEGSGVRQGVNFVQYKDGFAGFDFADIQALEAAFGRPMPLSAHGYEVNLFPKSLAKIRAEVGFNNWQKFQNYAQLKTVEYRYRLRVQQIKDGTKTEPYVYPGYDSFRPPWKLHQDVAAYEAEFPSFVPGYKDVTDYSDSLMLLAVLSGELSVAEAVRIKSANEEYVPLGRNLGTGGMGIGPATSPLEVNSGIKPANGSIAPFGNLQAILEQKTRRAYGAYYTHMFMNSMLEAQRFATVAAQQAGIPIDQMADVSRLMIPLGMRTVLNTEITDEKLLEISEKALKAINTLKAQAGEPPLTITAKDVQTQIGSIKFWGTDKPNGANVVAVFDPQSKNHEFYYIPDPMLFKQASFVNLKPNAGVSVWGDLMRGMNQPMKRVLTNSLTFAAWNVLVRDQVTAVMNAKTFRGRIPFYLTAYGLLNRLGVWKVPVGMTPNKWAVELGTIQLAGTHSAVNSNQGRALATQFFAQLGEGFEYNNWQDKTPYEKLIAIWGNAWATVVFPATVFNVFTGGPQAAALAESLTRQGAALEVLRTGGTQLEAMRQANEITGSFGTSGLNPNMRQIFAGSFFSASITSALELVFTMSDPDPKVGGIQTTLTKGAIITATFGMLALAVYMAMSLLRDDEWIKEWARNERDRPDQSRWREMNIFGFRAPFGYGPGGVLASLAYNGVLNAILVDDPIEMRSNAVAIATQFTNLPDIQAVIPLVLNVFVEQGLNWKFYAGRPIVPGYMMLGSTAEELKYYPDTAELYQEIGAGLGVSPLRVQHTVEGVMGRNVGQLVKMIDQMNLGVEVNPSNYPVIGSLITNEQPTLYTDAIQKLRLQADLFKQAEDTINKWGERTDRQAEVAAARKVLAETKEQSERYGEVLAWYSKSKDATTQPERAAALMKMVDVARSFFDVSDEGKEPHTLFTDEYIKKRVRVLQRAEDWTKPGYKELMEQKENAVLELQRLGGDGYRQRLGRLSFGAPGGGVSLEQLKDFRGPSEASRDRFDVFVDRIMSVGLSGTPGVVK